MTSISGILSLPALEELYISHNLLTALSGLETCTELRVLDISSNQIEQLAHISHLKHLEEFWASSNLMSSFDEVEKELADKQELKTVYFEGNPLQTKNPVLYRNKVKLALPQVQQIDASMCLLPKKLLPVPRKLIRGCSLRASVIVAHQYRLTTKYCVGTGL